MYDDRCRVGDTRRLDDDAPERRDLGAFAPAEEVAQLVGQVAAQRAADAAVAEHDGALVDPPQQVVVDRDLAELVDDHRRLAHVRVREQTLQQRRLAAAEEAGQQHHGCLLSQGQRTSSGSSGSSGRPASIAACGPEDAEVVDHGCAPLAVAQNVDAPRPVVELEAEVVEHAVHEPDAERPAAPPALLLGPVVVQQDTAERTH